MRWQATVTAPGYIYRLFAGIQALGDRAVVHISPEEVRVIMTGGLNLTDGEEVFVRIPVTGERSIFRDFRAESKRENNIFFTVDIANVLQAFRNVETECSIRLTKRFNQPFLSLYSDTATMTAVQDIPVEMATDAAKMQEECYEPELDDPEVKIRMPSVRVLKSIVERMRALNSAVVLEASVDGDLIISTSTIEVDIKTSFKDLALKPSGAKSRTVVANNTNDANGAGAAAAAASSSSSSMSLTESKLPTGPGTGRAVVSLKVKKLLNVLQYRPQDAFSAIACFVEKLCFVLHIKLFGGAASCTYYVPVLLEQA